jgi:hypothetical protein
MCWKEKIQWQSVTNGLRKEHVLRSPFSFLDKVLHFFFLMVICNSTKKSMQFHIFIIELQYQYLNYITGIPVFSPRFLCRLTALIKLLVAVQRQSVLYTENSGFASPTLGQHISMFRGYRILFSIINLI